ncbi:cupin domain-containing protein [Chryseobacterium sp. PTM-20240506]|uniref:cupin domain-containing protein n=1 Tax=unclassified Chryseobacterium TaxID=2593645 RepID=UPI002359612D|nr:MULTISPECIES: cupin domain-containing protein [unclassified Chryseobacterium]MDC8105879.1 cupin domain-containing protein [Chryseobacterium sp. B21-037]MDQ1804382.1 cupin domain-containing protein [Chryseobacterium sp. CKR4-1]
MDSKKLVETLKLEPHPEGGYYKETYRSEQTLTLKEGSVRNVSTAIYYMLENENKSSFHRIKSDELWFFHQGEPLEIVFIKDGNLQTIILGNSIENGEVPQAKIDADTWFAAKISSGKGYSLVSCTVAPGFDFLDFELAERSVLFQQYPDLKEVIEEFTH